jgi:hypothetical protein
MVYAIVGLVCPAGTRFSSSFVLRLESEAAVRCTALVVDLRPSLLGRAFGASPCRPLRNSLRA